MVATDVPLSCSSLPVLVDVKVTDLAPILLELPASERDDCSDFKPLLAARLFYCRALAEVMEPAIVPFDEQVTPIGNFVLETGADHAARDLLSCFQFSESKRGLSVTNLIEVSRPGLDDVD